MQLSNKTKHILEMKLSPAQKDVVVIFDLCITLCAKLDTVLNNDELDALIILLNDAARDHTAQDAYALNALAQIASSYKETL